MWIEMKNEIGDDIPDEIVAKARELNCSGEGRYVYIDAEYNDGFPVASLHVNKPRRFRSTNYEKHKQEIGVIDGIRYVAFASPSKTPREAIAPVPRDEIPPLPDARLDVVTSTYAIDDTPLNFQVVDGFILRVPDSPIKAYCVQMLKVDDGAGDAEDGNFAAYHYEIRIAYYMVAHKGRRRGTWQFGQFAPMMSPHDYKRIHQEIENREWLEEGYPRST